MRRSIPVLIFVLSSLLATACGASSSLALMSTVSSPTPSPSPIPQSVNPWNEVALPVDWGMFAFNDNKLYVVSDVKFAAITASGEVIKLPDLKVTKAFLTTNGGLRAKPLPLNDAGLCAPHEVLFASSVLYVYAICEHTTQLWTIKSTSKSSSVELMHFTYRNDEMDVPGPHSLGAGPSGLLMPSYMRDAPSLLTQDPKNGRLKAVWRAGKDDGGIPGLDMKGADGWMMMGSGKLMRTADGGKTWTQQGQVPKELSEGVSRLSIGNMNEFFLSGYEAPILSTSDGGATWQKEHEEKGERIDRFVVNDKIAVAAASSGTFGSNRYLLVRKQGENKWTKFPSPYKEISDIYLAWGRLYVLADTKLYYRDISTL